MTSKKDILATNDTLVQDIRRLIEEARSTVATTVNAALTMLYWRVGKRIVDALSAQLHQEYGQGFTKRNVFNMIRFAQVFPEKEIVSALRTQLNWNSNPGYTAFLRIKPQQVVVIKEEAFQEGAILRLKTMFLTTKTSF